MGYEDFLKRKQFEQVVSGFDIETDYLHDTLFDFQKGDGCEKEVAKTKEL